MADEGTIDVQAKYVTRTVTVAAKTTVTATLAVGERTLDTLDVKFAPGHVGLVGFRLNYGGVTMLPWNQSTSFIVGDNERLLYALGLHVSGSLSFVVQNLDTYVHTVQFTCKLLELDLRGGPTAPPLPVRIG